MNKLKNSLDINNLQNIFENNLNVDLNYYKCIECVKL